MSRGDSYDLSIFVPGDIVQVTGNSKGKGFQGVIKRHGFKGASASHGTKDQERMPGSIGATGPARVFKGMKMGGHMGDEQVTVKNLEIVEVDAEAGELLIKGALPGARGGLLSIVSREGEIEIKKEEAKKEEDKEEVINSTIETLETQENKKPEEEPTKDVVVSVEEVKEKEVSDEKTS